MGRCSPPSSSRTSPHTGAVGGGCFPLGGRRPTILPLPASFGSGNGSSGITIPGLFGHRDPDQPTFSGWSVPRASGGNGSGSKGGTGGGSNTVASQPSSTGPVIHPIPLGGGHGPAITLQPNRPIASLPRPQFIPGGGTGGGYNTSKGGNAMDTLGSLNTGGGINGVAGNSGGADSSRRTRFPVQVPPPKPQPGGGSGGINMVNGGSGNAPSTGGNFKPITKLKITPSAPSRDVNVDYGGCGGCGQPAKDPLVVR